MRYIGNMQCIHCVDLFIELAVKVPNESEVGFLKTWSAFFYVRGAIGRSTQTPQPRMSTPNLRTHTWGYFISLPPPSQLLIHHFLKKPEMELLSAFAVCRSVSLPEEPPSAPPQNVIASGRTNQSIMIQWQPPPEGHQNGILRGYTVR